MGGRGVTETRPVARFPRAPAGLALALLLGLGGCEAYQEVVTFLAPDLVALPTGAFEQPTVTPSGQARARFLAGHQAFAAACGACHLGDGRGAPAVAGDGLTETAILRLSPPDPRYGARLDYRAGPDGPAEARVAVAYRVLAGRFPDGEVYELRLPRSELSEFAAGPLAEGTSVSLRAAPPVIGTGLVAAIEEAALRARADPEDRDGDGISGRLGAVAQTEGAAAGAVAGPGRFGWKAAAAGFAHDALVAPEGAEANDLADYLESLGAPPRRNLDDSLVRRGGAVFAAAGCPACHVPQAVAAASTVMPETTFYPYSDFLLHDMGEGLADTGGGARAREWRTAPLWGLGRGRGGAEGPDGPDGATYLHDGRARNLMAAILWHGGEARTARKNARALAKEDRAALIAFLESL
jgi:CxxC motif-containing protein (DUF1111 family)